MVELFVSREIHLHGVSLKIIEPDNSGISIIYGVIDSLHIAHRPCLTRVSFLEIHSHLLGRDLIEMHGIHLLDAQSLPYHVSIMYGGILHIGMHHLSEHLSAHIPYDRILVHRHT